MTSFLLSPGGGNNTGGTNSRSSSSSSSHKRQLIRPTTHIPWTVDVVSAVPGPVSEILDTALSGATHNKWACLAFPKGIVYVWQTKQTSNLGESLQRPKEYVKFFFPDMIEDENDDSQAAAAPFVALSNPHDEDRGSIHLYVLHPTTGWLVLRKISRRDMRSKLPMTHTARVRIRIDIDDDIDDDDKTSGCDQEPVRFQALTCHKSMVVAATSRGHLYWITHLAVPVGLHVQKVEAPDNSGFFSRLLFGSSSTSGGNSDTVVGSSPLSANTIVVPLSSKGNSEFLAISIKSGVVLWKAEQPIASGHHAIFSPKPLGTLADSIVSSSEDDVWTVQEILKAVVSTDCGFLHCIVRGTVSGSGESRLYWIVGRLDGGKRGDGASSNEVTTANAMTIVRSHWLSRFALPDQLRVLGLVSCENDSVYAAVSASNDAVIVMALAPTGGGSDENNYIIQEVDLPMREIPDLLPSMMERDTVTNGCYMVASSGIGMRARYMPQENNEQQTPSKRRRLGNDKILMQHLRSHFWASYQDPNVDKPAPPSLLQADPADLEQAVVLIGAELQQKGVPSAHFISLEWQSSFIKLLQDDGLYRRLSDSCKWNLLGIGQELKVFGDMAQLLLHKYKHEEVVDSWQRGLQPQSMADWFLLVQKLVEQSGWLRSDVWYDLLGTALDSILKFRQQFAQTVYDVATKNSSVPLWMSHPSMQEMLKRQIKHWETNYQDVPLPLIEAVVKIALLSYSESLSPAQSSDESKMTRTEFAKIQKSGISLLRLLSDGRDELAFELCIRYRYFDGLCELSVAHQKKRDATSYSLDPLFDTMKGVDSRSGWSFPQHVLQWHTDKGLYGQVINYGRHSIADLNRIMEKNSQLRKFRWIPIVRQGYFGQATTMFLENCKEDNGLRNNQWALSMAKLTNKLVPSQSQQAKDQHLKIEKALDLVDAQQMLLDNPEEDCPILSPDELAELAMKKLGDSFEKDDQVRLAFIGLTICNFMDDKQASLEQTSRIWAECLLSDGAQWTEWALEGGGSSTADLAWLREEALSSTVFGRLLEECRKDDSMREVTYGRDIESIVIDRVQGNENRESFTRVLRVVAAPAAADSIRADSLMVSTY
jgi:hypothetical protein